MLRAMLLYGTVCNFRCAYCLNHAGRTDRRQTCLAPAQLALLPATLCALAEPVETLMLCGGEATVAADRLRPMIRTLPRVHRLKLFTNGFDLLRLEGLVADACTVADQVSVRISVHDCIYTAASLSAHLACWERLNTWPGVETVYVALVDGERAATYVDMLNHLARAVPGDRLQCVHVRRAGRDRDPTAMVHAAAVVHRLGCPELVDAFTAQARADNGVNPHLGGPCPSINSVLIVDEEGARGCTCASWRRPFTATPDEVAQAIKGAPPVTCTHRGIFCECGLDW